MKRYIYSFDEFTESIYLGINRYNIYANNIKEAELQFDIFKMNYPNNIYFRGLKIVSINSKSTSSKRLKIAAWVRNSFDTTNIY